MKKLKRYILLAVATACATSTARAQYTLTTLATFNGTNGKYPETELIADASSNLYGTTSEGGSGLKGTVFEVAASAHAISTLVAFNGPNGANPRAGLIADANGNLYGTTEGGGAIGFGTAFRVTAGSHAFTTLAPLTNSSGYIPEGGLVVDASGNLYGTAYSGGGGHVAVFELAAGSNTPVALASFNGDNGDSPEGNLIADTAGNLYGTARFGGANGLGTVFKVAAGTHALSALVSFNGANGQFPTAGLSIDASGNLYGTTSGVGNNGTLFEINAVTHTLNTLVSFNGGNGSIPVGSLLIDAKGNIFGTTASGGASGSGTVFEIDAVSHALKTLVSFNGTNGDSPAGGLLLDAGGNLYGTTQFGGANDDGTVSELSPVPEPSSLVLASCGLAMMSLTTVRRDWRNRNTNQPEAMDNRLLNPAPLPQPSPGGARVENKKPVRTRCETRTLTGPVQALVVAVRATGLLF